MENLKWSNDSLDINVIVLFNRKKNADVFFERIYPLWADPIVVTEDGYYPTNPVLKSKVFDELKTNVNLPIIVFDMSSYAKMNVLSKNVLNVGELIKTDTYRFTKVKPFNWTDFGLATLFANFASFDKLFIRPNNEGDLWIKNINPESLDWYHDLV